MQYDYEKPPEKANYTNCDALSCAKSGFFHFSKNALLIVYNYVIIIW